MLFPADLLTGTEKTKSTEFSPVRD